MGKQRQLIDIGGQAQREIVDHDRLLVFALGAGRAGLAERGRDFLEHLEAEMLERGDDIGQRERADRSIDPEPQQAVAIKALTSAAVAWRIGARKRIW